MISNTVCVATQMACGMYDARLPPVLTGDVVERYKEALSGVEFADWAAWIVVRDAITEAS